MKIGSRKRYASRRRGELIFWLSTITSAMWHSRRRAAPSHGTILVFDDATGRDHDCDMIVDAAASNEECYAGYVPARARVLTGPAYALVRRSFVTHRATALARRDGRPVQEILVSCGATDPGNATAAVLEHSHSVADEYFQHGRAVVAGSAYRRRA